MLHSLLTACAHLHLNLDAGCSVTTVLLQVSQGKRPCVTMIPDQRPPECEQMISIMKQCWDDDHRKRPLFSGAAKGCFWAFSYEFKCFKCKTCWRGQSRLLARRGTRFRDILHYVQFCIRASRAEPQQSDFNKITSAHQFHQTSV